MPTVLLVFEFLGTTELLVIAFVALIIFGPRKLPEIGRKVGQTLSEFKRASEDFKRTWEYEVETERTTHTAPRIEPETVVPRESLTGDDDEAPGGDETGVLSDEGAGADDSAEAPAETTAEATEAGASDRLPAGQTIARGAPDFDNSRAPEPDDDAPNVFEGSDPAPGKQFS